MKKVLMFVSFMFVSLSNAYAGNEPFDLINEYWDICEKAIKYDAKDTYDKKSIERMKKIIYYPTRQSAEQHISNGRTWLIKERIDNKSKYKGYLDLSRKIQIVAMKKNRNLGTLDVYYKHRAYQDESFTTPKHIYFGIQPEKSPKVMQFKPKKVNGKLEWRIY